MKRMGRCCSKRRGPSQALPSLAPVLAACLALLPPRRAIAQAPPPAERATIYSAYEEETIADVLAQLHREQDPSPEGKTIERVDIVPLRVFDKRDLVPGLVMWANV